MAKDDRKSSTASAELQKLFDDEWEFRLREEPLFATHYGDHRFDDKLPSVSEADHERRHKQTRKFFERLNGIDRDELAPEEQLSYDIFKRLKGNQIEGYQFRSYLMPITKAGGFHSSLPEMRLMVPLKTTEDYENYIARLSAFKTFVEQHIELMRTGMREGYVPARVTLEGIEDSVKPHIVEDPAKSLLFKPFEEFPELMDKKHHKRLIEEGHAAIRDHVLPAYKSLLKFLTEEYVAAGRSDISASSLPGGKAYYEHLVRVFTTPETTPQQVHDTGHAEVERIRKEMDETIRKVGFKGSFSEFSNFLRTDKRFFAKEPDELMKETAYILKKMDGELPRLFKTLPRMPYGIREIPDYKAPKSTTAYYWSPAGDGSRAGFYYVNTYDLKSRPLHEIETLSLHEAVPGHHLQISLQQELKDIPNFRRFGGFTAFVEGWALYSERLGLEVGFFEDPYRNFGRLTHEMWRACRLVIDTGMHYFGWERQKAVDFLAENTGLTILNINNEIDRYIAWPGQALAYKIGELKIRELRKLAEKILDERFNVREFHDVVLLNGAVPLDVLEANVKNWLAKSRRDTRK